jgi:hypothetical protein
MSFYTLAVMGTAPFGCLWQKSAKIIGSNYAIFFGGDQLYNRGSCFLQEASGLKWIARHIICKMGLILKL